MNQGHIVFNHIDLKQLSEICFDKPSFIVSVLESFRTTATDNLDLMLTHFVLGNFEEVRRIAHTIKTTGAHIGSLSYVGIVTNLEDAAERQQGAELASHIASLKNLTAKILEEIDHYLAAETSPTTV